MDSKCVLLGSTKAKPLCQIAINFGNIYSQFQCLSHGLAQMATMTPNLHLHALETLTVLSFIQQF